MIITRDIIRSDTTINDYSKNDLCEFINYWKIKLLDLDAKPGDKIGLSFDTGEIHYYALIFAAFELGMRVVSLHRPNNKKECQSPKSNAHLPLDYYVYLSDYLGNPLTSNAVRHFKKNSKRSISYGQLEWQTSGETFRSNVETPVYAQPDDIAFCCTSSGTTGNPKLITYTHKFLFDLMQHNWKDIGYCENDVMLHFSSLNHGGVITLLLPSLMKCKGHYFQTFSPDENRIVSTIKECINNNVTKIFFANGSELTLFIDTLCQYDLKLPETTILLLSFISPNWCNAIRIGKLKSIDSMFGCSEVGGPVFVPRLDADNVDYFNPRYLGKPTNSFYRTIVANGNIYISTSYTGIFKFDDVVKEKPNGYYFVSKKRLQKINDIDINPLDIVEILERYTTRYKFEIYLDEIYNQLYVLTTDKSVYEQKEKIKAEINSFYHDNVTVTDIILEPELYEATINNKADKDKLAGIVERFRLTSQKNSI